MGERKKLPHYHCEKVIIVGSKIRIRMITPIKDRIRIRIRIRMIKDRIVIISVFSVGPNMGVEGKQ